MTTPERYYPLGFNPEILKGQTAIEAIKSLILPNPEIAKVKFITYQPLNHARPTRLGSDTETRKYFWLTKAEIASGELKRTAQNLPREEVLGLAGYASLGEIVSPPQPELSFGSGESYYGLFPMIDYECPPSPENQAQIKKDLTERLKEKFGIIINTGNSYHYIGGCLMTDYLDAVAFCGA